MKISASVYSNTSRDLIELIKELECFNIDFIHIDCNDDIGVFEDIREIKKHFKIPIDLHVISNHPEKYFSEIHQNTIELVTFQYENLEKPLIIPTYINAKIGLAIMTDTNYKVIEQYKDFVSFVLFMTTTPGQSGGVFDEKNFQKIRNFKKDYPNKLIHVDGGVNHEVSLILRSLGVYCAVSGSYLVKAEQIGSALLQLKSELRGIHYEVKDFMLKNNEIPILEYSGLCLKDVLTAIDNYKMGFCLIVDEKQLVGIITDGDIRRALLRNIENLSSIDPYSLINKIPITIFENEKIKDLLQKIEVNSKPLSFIPVLDHHKHLKGVVSFNNLVKGEL